jgi:hypothetical protein
LEDQPLCLFELLSFDGRGLAVICAQLGFGLQEGSGRGRYLYLCRLLGAAGVPKEAAHQQRQEQQLSGNMHKSL